jgi:glycine oxidase
MSNDVVVVGGGAIGLAVAWRLAQRGRDAVVVDPEPGAGATYVAAGMLAPVTEVHYGEVPLLGLNLESARRWPSFAAEVEAAAGSPIGYRQEGTVAVALTDDDQRALGALVEFQERLHLPVERLSSAACRTLEPSLTPRVRGGARAPGDHQVEPRALSSALLAACGRAGVELDRRTVAALDPGPGVRLEDGEVLACDTVVVAAGCGSAGLVPVPIRPVKGQILRLAGDVAALLTRTVRGLWHGKSVYLVPRTDGELVVGATVEERGFDTTVTAGAVHELLESAVALVPGVAELELREARAGLRPGTPDNAPIIGPVRGVPDVVVATGHYRNGILLTPVTADAVADLVTSGTIPEAAAPFGLERFG